MIERTFYREQSHLMDGGHGLSTRNVLGLTLARTSWPWPEAMREKPPWERRGLDRTVEVRCIARDLSARSYISKPRLC